ncbi:MAG: TraR/DksA family transcriptional regulator [Deltaproteobacteria bacterium]|nr:TraR/DksA family transcriptional regulator [Deltaproteobacteria bacterium]
MSTRASDEHRQRLVDFRQRLHAEGDLEIEPSRDDPTKKVDEDAAPLAEMSQVIASSRNRARTQQLQQIEAALRRLEEDPEDFGQCETCDDPIPPRRLELMPWTRLCITCQSERESDGPSGASRKHLTDYR